jgi:putative intracellular protease/amidase
MTLEGKSVAVLIAPRGTEEPEFSKPKQAIEEAGGKVTVVSFEAGVARTVNSDLDEGGSYTIDKTFSEVKADDFDGLVVPGGTVGADKLRDNLNALVESVIKSNPTGAKGTYVQTVSLSTTMGPGVKLDAAALTAAYK